MEGVKPIPHIGHARENCAMPEGGIHTPIFGGENASELKFVIHELPLITQLKQLKNGEGKLE
jgi:hypothetical protein